MTKDQYLRMCEQTGEEIDWDRCPPEPDDFPESTLTAITIFNELGDRVYPDVGYVGKDFTNLQLLFDLYEVKTKAEIDWQMELLLFLENKTIEESQQKIKAAHDKIKR